MKKRKVLPIGPPVRRLHKIIMFGPPGSGKGTISKELHKRLGVPHISTGDMLREEVAAETPLGLEIKEIMGTGTLVPDVIVDALVEKTLKGKESYLLDGYPRTRAQAERLLEVSMPDIVIKLHVDEETILARVRKRADIEGRADDSEEIIKKRLKHYRDQEIAVLGLYCHTGEFNVYEVKGAESIEETTKKAIKCLVQAGLIINGEVD